MHPFSSCASSSAVNTPCATPPLPCTSFAQQRLTPLSSLSEMPYYERSLARAFGPSSLAVAPASLATLAAVPLAVPDTSSKTNLWASIRSKVGGISRGSSSTLPKFVVEESNSGILVGGEGGMLGRSTIGGRKGSKSERIKAAAGTIGMRWRKAGGVKDSPIADDESFINVSPTPSNPPELTSLTILFSNSPMPPPRTSSLAQPLPASSHSSIVPSSESPPKVSSSSIPSLSLSSTSCDTSSSGRSGAPVALSVSTARGLNILLDPSPSCQQLDTQIPSPRLSFNYFSRLPSPILESPSAFPSLPSKAKQDDISMSSKAIDTDGCKARNARREGFILGGSSKGASSPLSSFVSPPTSPPGVLRKSVRSLAADGSNRPRSTQGRHRSKKSLTNPNLLSTFPPPTSPLPPLPPSSSLSPLSLSTPLATSLVPSASLPTSPSSLYPATPALPALPSSASPYLRPSAPTPSASASAWSAIPTSSDTVPPLPTSAVTHSKPSSSSYQRHLPPSSSLSLTSISHAKSSSSSSSQQQPALSERGSTTRIPQRRPKTLDPSLFSSSSSSLGASRSKKAVTADSKAGAPGRRHPLSLSTYKTPSKKITTTPRKVTPPTSHPDFAIADPFAAPGRFAVVS